MFLTADNKIKWRRLAVATGVVAATIVVTMVWFDKPLLEFMRNFDCRAWGVFERLFDIKVWLVVTVGVWGVFYLKKSYQSKNWPINEIKHFNVIGLVHDFYDKTKRSYAFLVFSSVFAAGLVTTVLKVLIGRSRPTLFETWGITEFDPMSVGWMYNSMPSGHAAATFAGLVMLGLLNPRIKVFTWTLATIVGASRVACCAHWPTDVLFGAFIGMVAADFVKAYMAKRD